MNKPTSKKWAHDNYAKDVKNTLPTNNYPKDAKPIGSQGNVGVTSLPTDGYPKDAKPVVPYKHNAPRLKVGDLKMFFAK